MGESRKGCIPPAKCHTDDAECKEKLTGVWVGSLPEEGRVEMKLVAQQGLLPLLCAAGSSRRLAGH